MELNNPYKTLEKNVSDGVFDVDYLKSIAFAYADNNQGVFVGLTNECFIEAGSEFEPANDNNFEFCAGIKLWQLNKFR